MPNRRKDKIRTLVEEIYENAGTERGEKAKMKYEVLKLETERKRNNLLFAISIALFLISLINVCIAILKYKEFMSE